ncbi:accessory gene regulator ArgB-like protein [Lacrimispora brassicae]
MLQELSLHIADNLIQTHNIDKSEKDIYVFGLETMLMYAVNFISTLIIAVLMKQVGECLMLMFLFMPLRSNAGGYHASTPLRCYLLSNSVVALALMSIRYLSGYTHIGVGVLLLSVASIVVMILAPVENENKPLDPKERKVYGRRARITLMIEVCFCLLCCLLSWYTFFWLGVLVVIVAAISLMIGLVAGRTARG